MNKDVLKQWILMRREGRSLEEIAAYNENRKILKDSGEPFRKDEISRALCKAGVRKNSPYKKNKKGNKVVRPVSDESIMTDAAEVLSNPTMSNRLKKKILKVLVEEID